MHALLVEQCGLANPQIHPDPRPAQSFPKVA